MSAFVLGRACRLLPPRRWHPTGGRGKRPIGGWDAERNTRTILVSLLQSLGFRTITVNFAGGDSNR